MATRLEEEQADSPRAAFARVKVELEALPARAVLKVNLDVVRAIQVISGAIANVRDLRPQLVTHLPTFDLAMLDKLSDYTLALTYIHAQCLITVRAQDPRRQLLPKAKTLRAMLLADAKALACREVISPRPLTRLKGTKGYENVAHDLELLATNLRFAWPTAQGRCGFTLPDLDSAMRLCMELRTVPDSGKSGAEVDRALDLRARAFTLVARAYADIRRAVAYVRGAAGDAGLVAPSLYGG